MQWNLGCLFFCCCYCLFSWFSGFSLLLSSNIIISCSFKNVMFLNYVSEIIYFHTPVISEIIYFHTSFISYIYIYPNRVLPEDYGVMGLRYGSEILSIGSTFMPFPCKYQLYTYSDILPYHYKASECYQLHWFIQFLFLFFQTIALLCRLVLYELRWYSNMYGKLY